MAKFRGQVHGQGYRSEIRMDVRVRAAAIH